MSVYVSYNFGSLGAKVQFCRDLSRLLRTVRPTGEIFVVGGLNAQFGCVGETEEMGVNSFVVPAGRTDSDDRLIQTSFSS